MTPQVSRFSLRMPCLSLTLLPIVSTKSAFNPNIDDIALLQQWGQAKTRARKRLAALERYQEAADDRFLRLLDDLIAFVKLRSDEAGFWSHYHPDEGMRSCGNLVRLGAQRLLLEIFSSSKLMALLEPMNTHKLDAEGVRYLCFIIGDFRRAGAYLCDEDRRALKQIDARLADLSCEYVLLPEESDLWIDPEHLQHMPQDFQDSHQVEPSLRKVKILVADDYLDLAEYCSNDEILRELYILRESRAPKNEEVLKTMMEIRHQKAKIFGSVRYPSFPHYAVELDMMSCPDTVRSFLVDVNDRARSRADDEKRALSAVLEEEQRHLNEWNAEYAKRRLWERKYPGFNPFSARSYFPRDNVMNGAMAVLSKLFAIEFHPVEGVETWHPSVLAFDVSDAAYANPTRGNPAASSGDKESSINTTKHGRLYLD
jgi:Zn-dependent oligopeptidase